MKTRLNLKFERGLNIRINRKDMGFEYGQGSFGPVVENRKLEDIRPSLLDPDCDGPSIVYAIAMDVGKKIHREALTGQHLLFGLVTYSSGLLGKEPVRSQGHIHKKSDYANGWSTPEVYQIWEGKAIIYMQEYAGHNPGKCYAVYAEPGDIVIVPPFWAHATISADPDHPLTFGAWCDRDYGFEYKDIRSRNGLAWYPVYTHGGLTWQHNANYDRADLVEKIPESYEDFNIDQGVCIYKQYEGDHNRFDFVPRPDLKDMGWLNFIP